MSFAWGTDMEILHEDTLRKLYYFLVEPTTGRRLPQVRYRTVNELCHLARHGHGVIFDRKTAFLPAFPTSVTWYAPDANAGVSNIGFHIDHFLSSQAMCERNEATIRARLMLSQHRLPRIRKIVGFTCSCMERLHEAYRTEYQIHFMLAFRTYLLGRYPGPVNCYLQGPHFPYEACLEETHTAAHGLLRG